METLEELKADYSRYFASIQTLREEYLRGDLPVEAYMDAREEFEMVKRRYEKALFADTHNA
jgi:hypothetical protein